MPPAVIVGKKYVEKVVPLIDAARSEISIIIFDWRLRPKESKHPVTVLVLALQRAAGRGVRVRALVSSALVVEQLRFTGIKVKVLNWEHLMHAKVMLIDNCIAVVGSHNYTQSAFTKNLEVSLVVQFSEADNDLSKLFNNLWSV